MALVCLLLHQIAAQATCCAVPASGCSQPPRTLSNRHRSSSTPCSFLWSRGTPCIECCCRKRCPASAACRMSDSCSDSFSHFVLTSSCFPSPLALFDLLQPAPRRHRAFRFNAVGEPASLAVMHAKSFWSSAISIFWNIVLF